MEIGTPESEFGDEAGGGGYGKREGDSTSASDIGGSAIVPW